MSEERVTKPPEHIRTERAPERDAAELVGATAQPSALPAGLPPSGGPGGDLAQHRATVQRLPSGALRQAFVQRLGRQYGNAYLQRVLAHTNAASGPAIQQPVVQREEESGVEAPDVNPPAAEGGSGADKYLETEVALKVLEDSFGSYKKMVKGTVKVLAQAEFQVAYDAIYGTTKYSWEKYVKPKFGNLGGFAHTGTNYVNSNVASSTTVPHEMLHNNADTSWSGFAGSNIDEGTTEHLTFVALKAAKYTGMTSKYPNQYGVITDLVAVIGDEVLKKAYFTGANEDLRKAFNRQCKGAWVDFKTKMDEANWTQAKALAVANT